jgi:hypothetical protein
MTEPIKNAPALTVHEAPAWCGECGSAKAGPYLPCDWCQARLKELGVAPDHDCRADGTCGDYPPYSTGAPGEPRHEPTWCQFTDDLDGGQGFSCEGTATHVVVADGSDYGVSVCGAHKGWAETDGAPARAAGWF